MIIGIGGEPAVGKSTLMREVLSRLPPPAPFKQGLVSGTLHGTVAVLGRYVEGDPFPGTDRLSMAVSPAFVEWLDEPGRPKSVLFEGDRLFTGTVIDACSCRFEPCRFLLLYAAPDTFAKRRVMRVQSEQFLKGRVTKYRNLVDHPNVVTQRHETAWDTKAVADLILRNLAQ
jgi:hypothetical protein